MLDLRYIAGLFDGEGCVTTAGPKRQIVVKLGMLDHRIPIALQSQFGGGLSEQRYTSNRRTLLAWRCTGRNAIRFMLGILPWLITKRDVVLRAIDLLVLKAQPRKMRCTKTNALRADVLASQLSIIADIRRLNHRGMAA